MKPFLTAQWRHLAMLNYQIDPALLLPRVPQGTELDAWNGHTFVSIVGFLFLDTKVLGWPITFHRDFEEVNLRFYVRRKGAEGWRRGVVFIQEIVPRAAIAWAARRFYNENYIALPMRHKIEQMPDALLVEYAWRCNGHWSQIRVKTIGDLKSIASGSEEEFITEHYWGYARQRDGGTIEYQVEHPRWRVWQTSEVAFRCDVENFYGPEFRECLNSKPSSAFLADGSSILVQKGVRLGS